MAGTPGGSDSDGRSLFVAISSGTVHRLQSIIPAAQDLNIRDGALRTPLIAAVGIPNDESRAHVVRLLVRHGCDVNAQDQTGRTSLMLACQDKEKADVVAVLAKSRDLDPNMQDLNGNSALHLAVESGNVAAIRLLTNVHSAKARLRINQPNHAGLSPLQLAVKLGLADCCRILIQHGGADTTLIKNRESLLHLINEDRAATPFDSSLGMNLENGVIFDSPLNSARGDPHASDNPAGWGGTTSRSNSELFRAGSRANSSTSLTRPSSDLHSARESARLRLEAYSRVSDSTSRNTSRGLDSFGKSSSASNPFADVMREKSDLYVNNSRTTFKKSIVPKKLGSVQQSHGDWLRQNLNARRPLTPIAARTITEECASPVNTHVPHPGRLPSIPSGKRLCLVSPRETPTELF